MIIDYVIQTSEWMVGVPWYAGALIACLASLLLIFAACGDDPPESTPGLVALVFSLLGFLVFAILLLVCGIRGSIEDRSLRLAGYQEIVTQAGYDDARAGESMNRWLAYKGDDLVEVFVEDLGDNEFLVTEIPRG